MNILKKFVFTLFIFQANISLAQTIIPSSPEINVESYILMDASTGKIIASVDVRLIYLIVFYPIQGK